MNGTPSLDNTNISNQTFSATTSLSPERSSRETKSRRLNRKATTKKKIEFGQDSEKLYDNNSSSDTMWQGPDSFEFRPNEDKTPTFIDANKSQEFYFGSPENDKLSPKSERSELIRQQSSNQPLNIQMLNNPGKSLYYFYH